MTKTRYHGNGQVTYWSVMNQRWVKTRKVDTEDLATMSPKEVERIERHTSQMAWSDELGWVTIPE